jgi:hypothetical protein
MASRLKLHEEFCEILGTRNVYFQPPASKRMSFPAIVYDIADRKNLHANDTVYKQDVAYEVTVIDENPDSEFAKKVSMMPKCRWNRAFKSDNLNHEVYTLYY